MSAQSRWGLTKPFFKASSANLGTGGGGGDRDVFVGGREMKIFGTVFRDF